MATSKPKAKSAAKKAAPKAATKAPAKKAVAKPVAKPAAKPAAKTVAKPVSKPATKAAPAKKPVAKPVAVAKPTHLHAVPSVSKRANAPAPKWLDEALAMAQQNPAVSIVSIIAVAIGILLILG